MSAHVSLTITDNAKRMIVSLTSEYEAKIQKEAIPAILWLDADLNGGIVESQPIIGFYHDRSEIGGDILIIDGLQIVLAIPEHDNDRFHGKTLDYRDDRFVLQ
jgi:hypothetical protein